MDTPSYPTCPINCFSITEKAPAFDSAEVCHRPCDLRHVLGNAADHLAFEVFDNLRAPLLPPLIRLSHLLRHSSSSARPADSGKDVGFRLVVVGVIGILFISARAGSKRFDARAAPSCFDGPAPRSNWSGLAAVLPRTEKGSRPEQRLWQLSAASTWMRWQKS